MSPRGQAVIGQVLVISWLVVAVSCFLTEVLEPDSCVCITEEAGVSRKAGFVHPVVSYLSPGTCTLTAGGFSVIYGASWYSINVESTILWCAGKFLINGTITNGKYETTISDIFCRRHE